MLKKILKRKFKKLFSMQTAFVVINIVFILVITSVHFFTKIDDMLKVFIYLLAFIIFKIVENILDELTVEKTKVIRPSKRFTHKNDDTGAIEVRKEDLQEAILYLYELENQIALKR